MKGNAKVLKLLSELLRMELTAINQYAMHAKMCKSWGYGQLHQQMWNESIDEMKHVEILIERLLFLGGTPQLDRLEKLQIGKTSRQQLQNDLRLETKALKLLHAGIDLCENVGDHVTGDLLHGIAKDEECHVQWIEAQLHQIGEVGYELWLSRQV